MKKMNNNKGFSLIELIIVIAIMAVLVAIIAPNLTKYLGKSKSQTDNTNREEVKKQVKNCIAEAGTEEIAVKADDDATKNATYVVEGTGKSGGVAVVAPASKNGTADFAALLKSVFDDDLNTKSKVTPANKYIEVTISGTISDGYTVTCKHVSTS